MKLDEDWLPNAALVCAFLLFSCGVFYAGYSLGWDHACQEAADAGAAEWRIDSKTGVRRFEWLVPEGE